MADTVFLSLFTPSRTDPEVLEQIFVQREDLAQDTLDRIVAGASGGGKPQILFIGPRGSGKTHLVTLLFHRLNSREDLRDRLRIAWLEEDETTTTFQKLMLRIYHALQQRYADEFPALDTAILQALDVNGRTRWLTRTLLEKLSGRTLLIIVENLDERFKDLGEAGQKEWRAFLQEHTVAITLATAQQLSTGVSRRVSPFFGFFQIEHLKPLQLNDAVLLLTKIAEELHHDRELATFLRSPTGRSRVRALFHLSGGNHRIYIALSRFITRESLDELIGPFEKLLDELTPYYQARLAWLSPQQREIVEFLARARYALPVKHIAAELLMPHQTVTAQLKELKDKGYVLGRQVGREARYDLTEPLLRLCVEVKDNHRQPIRLLVDFLRLWYSRDQLQRRLQEASSYTPVERRYLEFSLRTIDAGAESPVLRSLLRDMQEQRRTGNPRNVIPVLQELAAARGELDDWIELARAQQKAGDMASALLSYGKAAELIPGDAAGWFNKGYALSMLHRFEEALRSCERAIELRPEQIAPWLNKGISLIGLGRNAEALQIFEHLIGLDPSDALAWIGKGIVLATLGRVEDVLRSCERGIELRPDVAPAWSLKGWALTGLGRQEEALRSFERSIELNPSHSFTWFNKSNALHRLGRDEEALGSYDRALDLDPANAVAWFNRGVTLIRLGRNEEALGSFDRALDLDPANAAAWSTKGITLGRLGRDEEALRSYDRALDLDPANAAAWNNKGHALSILGRDEEALGSFDRALDLDPANAAASFNRGITLSRLRREGEALRAVERAIVINPDEPVSTYSRVEVLFALHRWDEGLAALRQALSRFSLTSPDGPCDVKSIISTVFLSTEDRTLWRERLVHLVAAFAEGDALTHLGAGLLRSFKSIRDTSPNPRTLRDWSEVWQEVGLPYEALQLPLRMYEVGLRYLETEDSKVLLDLISVERRVVEQALGLDAAPEHSASGSAAAKPLGVG
jgi:tetratricopeptide (TPR) repeat protein